MLHGKFEREHMNCLIRKAAARDYDPVNRIFQQVHQMHVDWRPDIYQPCERLISPEGLETPAEGTAFYVAEAGGQVVGILELVVRRIQSPAHVSRRILFIEAMAVDEAYRGNGIGHQFFETVKQLREEHNLDGIELQVNAKNKAAYEMYLKYGFTEKSIQMELL